MALQPLEQHNTTNVTQTNFYFLCECDVKGQYIICVLLLIKKGVCTQQRKSVKVNDNQILNNATATHVLQGVLYEKIEVQRFL